MEKKKLEKVNDNWLRNNVITTIIAAGTCIGAAFAASKNIHPQVFPLSVLTIVGFFYRRLRKDFESHRNYHRVTKLTEEYTAYRKSFSREPNQKEFELFAGVATDPAPVVNTAKPGKARVTVKKDGFLKRIAASFTW